MAKLLLKNKTYDVLVYVAQYVLPALGTFWATISKIWGIPYGIEIVGTILAVDLLLGALLGISNVQYKKTQ